MTDVQRVMISSVKPLIECLEHNPDIEYLMVHCTVSFWKTVLDTDLREVCDALRGHSSLKILVFSGNSSASLEQVGILVDFLQECRCPIRAVVFQVTDPSNLIMDIRMRNAIINKILFRAFTCPTIQKITFSTGVSMDQESVWIQRMNQKLETILKRGREHSCSSKY
jgi:hypothetical protein